MNIATETLNPVNKAISKYRNRPNILEIKNALGVKIPSLFSHLSLSVIEEELSKFKIRQKGRLKHEKYFFSSYRDNFKHRIIFFNK